MLCFIHEEVPGSQPISLTTLSLHHPQPARMQPRRIALNEPTAHVSAAREAIEKALDISGGVKIEFTPNSYRTEHVVARESVSVPCLLGLA